MSDEDKRNREDIERLYQRDTVLGEKIDAHSRDTQRRFEDLRVETRDIVHKATKEITEKIDAVFMNLNAKQAQTDGEVRENKTKTGLIYFGVGSVITAGVNWLFGLLGGKHP